MTSAAALLNAGTGIAYAVGVGFLSFVLARQAWRAGDRGLAIVFIGLVGMASSCGPHHLHLGEHFARGLDTVTTPDLIAIAAAAPFGAAWLWWQAGAVYGRWAGDWRIGGEHDWPVALLVATVVYVVVIVARAARGVVGSPREAAIQIVLLGLYSVVGYLLWTGQLQRRRIEGAWSAKGVALATIFPTCGAAHATYGLAVASGQYASDAHFGGEAWIDTWGLVVAVFFVVVTVRQRRTHHMAVTS